MSTEKPRYACPNCADQIVWSTSNAWRPFCSERCRMEDLAKWANDEYAVPVTDADNSSEGSQ